MSRRPGGAGRQPPRHRRGRRRAAVQPGQAALGLHAAWMVGRWPPCLLALIPLPCHPSPMPAPAVPALLRSTLPAGPACRSMCGPVCSARPGPLCQTGRSRRADGAGSVGGEGRGRRLPAPPEAVPACRRPGPYRQRFPTAALPSCPAYPGFVCSGSPSELRNRTAPQVGGRSGRVAGGGEGTGWRSGFDT